MLMIVHLAYKECNPQGIFCGSRSQSQINSLEIRLIGHEKNPEIVVMYPV